MLQTKAPGMCGTASHPPLRRFTSSPATPSVASTVTLP
jgi:hypothetical protein